MRQKFSIILDYEDYVDIRFLSNFLYHLKASNTYIYKQYKYKDENYIIELIKFIDGIFVNSNEKFLKLDNTLSILSNNKNFNKVYTKYVKTPNKYGLFISENANIEILSIEKGSIRFILISMGLSAFILSSAIAYKIIKSKEASLEINIPKIINVKVITKDE